MFEALFSPKRGDQALARYNPKPGEKFASRILEKYLVLKMLNELTYISQYKYIFCPLFLSTREVYALA